MSAPFKGFKQVTQASYDQTQDADKIGYLWFVRSNITGDSYDGDIYFGTKHYGHFGGEVEELEERLNNILTEAGILDESGNTVVLSTIYLSKTEAEETYVDKPTLFNSGQTGEVGILIVQGNDVDEE